MHAAAARRLLRQSLRRQVPARAAASAAAVAAVAATAAAAKASIGGGYLLVACDDAPPRPACGKAPPGLEVRSATTGGRGLFTTERYEQGAELFGERAALDSMAPSARRRLAFKDGVPGLRAGAEPIWGVVANFVTLRLQAAGRRATPAPGSVEGWDDKLATLDAFYRPGADLPGADVYERHASHIHQCLQADAQAAVPPKALADLLLSVRLNAHNVAITMGAVGERGTLAAKLGLGLFFWLHLANHSCMPNAFFSASAEHGEDGDIGAGCGTAATMTLYALRPIEAGEEVCISYVDGRTLLQPLPARRSALLRQFGFHCRCKRCCAEEAAAARQPLPVDGG